MSRTRTSVHLGGVATLCLAAVACSSQSPEASEPGAASQEQPVWSRGAGGAPTPSNDRNEPARNVVVRIPKLLNRTGTTGGDRDPGDTGCAGVMLTPALVLTSKHCVSDAKGGPFPVVEIGATNGSLRRRGVVRIPALMPASPDASGIDTADLALVFLESPPTREDREAAAAVRPSLDAPAAPAPIVPARSGGDRTFAKIEMVGWSKLAVNAVCQSEVNATYENTRQAVALEDASLFWLTADERGTLFARGIHDPMEPGTAKAGLHKGDVGSPLFVYPDKTAATGNLVGIATTIGMGGVDPTSSDPALRGERATPVRIAGTTCDTARCDVWIDVTSAPVRAWIQAQAEDHSRDAKKYWQRAHARKDGKVRADGRPDWWIGEADYAGACRSGDSDCDGWFDTNDDGTRRDNCPSTFNPDQLDSDDDWVGDACEAPDATSADNDPYPNGADNCPVFQSNQNDGDADGVGDACDFCPSIYDTDPNKTACVATCGTVALGNNAVGQRLAIGQSATSPASYGTAGCDGQWIVEWDSKGFEDLSTGGGVNAATPPELCGQGKAGGTVTMWGQRKSDRQWEQFQTFNFHSFYSTGTGGGFQWPKGCNFDWGYASVLNDRYSRVRAAVSMFETVKEKDIEVRKAKPVTVNVYRHVVIH